MDERTSAPPVQPDSRAERVLALLGLARRAGRLAIGATAAEHLVRRGARPVVLVASDAGASQLRRVLRWQPVRGFVTGLIGRRELAERLGRSELAVVAVADAGFVRGLIELGVVAEAEAKDAASPQRDGGRR